MNDGDEVASELLPVPKWTQRAWKELRGALIYSLMLGSAGSYVVDRYFERYPPTKGVTKEDVAAMIKPLQTSIDLYRAENLIFRDSLQRLRLAVDTQFVRPMLLAQAEDSRRLSRLESGGVLTRLEVQETKQEVKQSTAELMESLNMQTDMWKQDEQHSEQKDARQLEKIWRILEALAKKNKVDTREF